MQDRTVRHWKHVNALVTVVFVLSSESLSKIVVEAGALKIESLNYSADSTRLAFGTGFILSVRTDERHFQLTFEPKVYRDLTQFTSNSQIPISLRFMNSRLPSSIGYDRGSALFPSTDLPSSNMQMGLRGLTSALFLSSEHVGNYMVESRLPWVDRNIVAATDLNCTITRYACCDTSALQRKWIHVYRTSHLCLSVRDSEEQLMILVTARHIVLHRIPVSEVSFQREDNLLLFRDGVNLIQICIPDEVFYGIVKKLDTSGPQLLGS